MMDNYAQLEGLLFIAGDEGISISDLARLTGLERPAINQLLDQLAQSYQADPHRALTLLKSGEVCRLATKAALAPVMKAYFEAPLTTPLSPALLEVLAIVAYKQPLTRLEIDDLRGVQSSGSLQKLVVRGLVTTHGRLDVPGRPFRYVTTPAFLDYFGLQDLQDLPPLPEGVAVEDLDGDVFLRALQSRQVNSGKGTAESDD